MYVYIYCIFFIFIYSKGKCMCIYFLCIYMYIYTCLFHVPIYNIYIYISRRYRKDYVLDTTWSLDPEVPMRELPKWRVDRLVSLWELPICCCFQPEALGIKDPLKCEIHIDSLFPLAMYASQALAPDSNCYHSFILFVAFWFCMLSYVVTCPGSDTWCYICWWWPQCRCWWFCRWWWCIYWYSWDCDNVNANWKTPGTIAIYEYLRLIWVEVSEYSNR